MKREEIKAILGDGATDEIVNAIMAAHGKDLNKANASAAELQDQLAAAKTRVAEFEEAASASLSAEEKYQKALDDANAKTAEVTRQLNEMCAVAEFKAAGLTEEEYSLFLGAVVGSDRDKTVEAAKAIASTVTNRAAKAREEAAKTALEGMSAPAGGEPAGDGMPKTKKEFLAMSYSKQVELKAQNPDIVSQLK